MCTFPGPLPPRAGGSFRRLSCALALLPALALAGCRLPPSARALDAPGALADVEAGRAPATPGPGTLAEAVGWMRRRNPQVREARADLAAAEAAAGVRTPPPNPVLDAGPLLLGGADVLARPAWGFEAALGWLVPLLGEAPLADAVRRRERDTAFAVAAAVEREEYLALREAWAAAALGAEQRAEQARWLEAAARAARAAASLSDAGEIAVLDARLLDLDLRRARLDARAAEEREEAARLALARRLGHAAAAVRAPGPEALPALATEVPGLEVLVPRAALEHPRLAALRARHRAAQEALRLETARARPGLRLGASLENEDGARRVGFPLGVELPLFERNPVERARARAEVARLEAHHAAQLERTLGEVEEAHALLCARRARLAALEAEDLPAARAAAEAAATALEAGQADALRALEVQRAHRELERERLEARRAVIGAWSALERAVGFPLLSFPDEPGAAPSPPHAHGKGR